MSHWYIASVWIRLIAIDKAQQILASIFSSEIDWFSHAAHIILWYCPWWHDYITRCHPRATTTTRPTHHTPAYPEYLQIPFPSPEPITSSVSHHHLGASRRLTIILFTSRLLLHLMITYDIWKLIEIEITELLITHIYIIPLWNDARHATFILIFWFLFSFIFDDWLQCAVFMLTLEEKVKVKLHYALHYSEFLYYFDIILLC